MYLRQRDAQSLLAGPDLGLVAAVAVAQLPTGTDRSSHWRQPPEVLRLACQGMSDPDFSVAA
jgi:hypothetical protein